jgi:hypothetical protein
MSGVLFLIRGLPGSGKTSFATAIWNDYAVCEADKFFVGEDGIYRFDATKLKYAHEWCKEQVETKMIEHQNNQQYYPEIAVSNTFTQEWEVQPLDVPDSKWCKTSVLIRYSPLYNLIK